MSDFKVKMEEILEQEGINMSDNILDTETTYENVIDYCAKLSKDGYDHSLIDSIQMYKFNNMNISHVFLGKVEMIERAQQAYQTPSTARSKPQSPRRRRPY
jgi:hypothetical protein